MMLAKITSALLSIGFAALISGALFPPGDVPRQLVVVLVWLFVGIAIGLMMAQHS